VSRYGEAEEANERSGGARDPSEQIVIRQAKTDWLWWVASGPEAKGAETLERGYRSPAATPDWVADTKLEAGGAR